MILLRRALGITRVSTAEQANDDRYSLPHQKAHISEWCKQNHIELVHIFEFVVSGARVLSTSAATSERQQILRFIRNHGVNMVIVHELDRLARSMLDTLLFTDELHKMNVTFVSIHDNIDTAQPGGDLQMKILAAFAEHFRRQLATKVLGSMIERAKEGKPLGRRPYGYTFTTGGYEIVPEEAAVVRKMFSLYLDENIGLRGIADYFNSLGVRTQTGGAWAHATVRDILKNEVYTGTFRWKDVRIPEAHEAIIDTDTFFKAQTRLERKASLGGRAQNSTHLLSGLLRCGLCGASLTGAVTRQGKGHYVHRYYRCVNYVSKGKAVCPAGQYSAEHIEKVVLDDVAELLREVPRELYEAEIQRVVVSTRREEMSEELSMKRRDLSKAKNRLDTIARAFEDGLYDAAYFKARKETTETEIQTIEEEIKRLEAALQNEVTPEEFAQSIRAKLADFTVLLSTNDTPALKAMLQEIIDRIEVRSKEDITITYRI